MSAFYSQIDEDRRVPVEADLWGDSPDLATTEDEAPGSGGFALGRFLAFVGLVALTALGIGMSLGDRRAVEEMPHRFCFSEAAWRHSTFNQATECLFGANEFGRLDRLDLRSGRVDHWGPPGPAVRALALDPSGATLATGHEDGSVVLRDAATGVVRWQTAPAGPAGGPTRATITSLAYHPDGRTLVAGLANGVIQFLDPADGRTLHATAVHKGAVTQLAFVPSGQSLVSASTAGTVRLSDGTTGRTERTILAAHASIRHLALAPDGRTLALSLVAEVGCLTGKLLVMDLARPDAPARLLGESSLCDVAFTPNSRFLIAAGFDCSVRQWDVASGRLLATGLGHQGYINQLHVTADGRQAITSGEDCLIGLFDLQNSDVAS